MLPFEQMPALVVPGQSNSCTGSRIRARSWQWLGLGRQHSLQSPERNYGICRRQLQGHSTMDQETDASSLAETQARLSRLVSAGALPDRITAEIGALVADWASEPEMAGSTAQARIERLWDGFTRDAAELQEQLGDADGPGTQQLALAQRQLAALQAIVAALEAAHAVLPGAEQ